MQWVIYPLCGLLAINAVVWIVQGVIVEMSGGQHYVAQTCPPSTPRFLCGSPFVDAINETGSGSQGIGGGVFAAARSAISNIASISGTIYAVCSIDYAILQGDPTGQSSIAPYFTFFGWILAWIGRILCVIIGLALVAPVIGRALSFI